MHQEETPDIMALDEALKILAEIASRKSRVVELRYFGGLRVEETSGVLGVSRKTVMRDWNTARAWLLPCTSMLLHSLTRLFFIRFLFQIALQVRVVPIDDPLVIVPHFIDRGRGHAVAAIRVAHPFDFFA